MKSRLLDRIFPKSSNSIETLEEGEILRKQIILYLLSFLGIVFLVLMSLRLFGEKEFFYAFLNLGFGVFLLILFFLVRTGKRLLLYSIVSVLLLQAFFMFLFHSGAGGQKAFIWYYLFPLVSLFLLGTNLGSFLSLFLIGASVLLNALSNHLPMIVPFSKGEILRIIYSYIAVFLFALVFEQTRRMTQKKLEKSMAELNELAIRDTLTGLYNRRYMDEVILRVVNQCRRVETSVVFIMADLDYFKKYNDTYGHQAGDTLLVVFSDMLRSLVRRQTDFVFRYGGEEFAILLSATTEETAKALAKKIVQETGRLGFPHEGSPFGVASVSLGVVCAPYPSKVDFQELIRLADNALYQAKETGRNRYCMSDE